MILVVNKGEKEDMMKWTEEVSDLYFMMFKRVLDIIDSMNEKATLSNHYLPTLFTFVFHRWFWIIINSSDSLILKVSLIPKS